MKTSFYKFVCLLLVTSLYAETPPGKSPEGIWQGTVMGMRQHLTSTKDKDGKLTGTQASVDQSSEAVSLDVIAFKAGRLHYEIKAFLATYDGTLNDAGTEISGVWKQAGQSASLMFK